MSRSADPDRAIRIVNALRAHLCELVALSANSPFWRGEPTGFASCRHLIFSAFPRSGPPPHFRDYAEYADVDPRARRGAAASRTTRGSGGTSGRTRRFGTVEVRVMDAVTRRRRRDRARRLRPGARAPLRRRRPAALCHPVLANENKWRAARYGLDGTVVDVVHGGPAPIRAADRRAR